MDWGTTGIIFLFAIIMLFCCGGMILGLKGSQRKKPGEDDNHKKQKTKQVTENLKVFNMAK